VAKQNNKPQTDSRDAAARDTSKPAIARGYRKKTAII